MKGRAQFVHLVVTDILKILVASFFFSFHESTYWALFALAQNQLLLLGTGFVVAHHILVSLSNVKPLCDRFIESIQVTTSIQS